GWGAHPPLPRVAIPVPAMGTLALREVWEGCAAGEREERLRQHIDRELGRHAGGFRHFEGPGRDAAGLVLGLGSTVTDCVWALAGRPRRHFRSERVHGLRATVAQLAELRRPLGQGAPAAAPGPGPPGPARAPVRPAAPPA